MEMMILFFLQPFTVHGCWGDLQLLISVEFPLLLPQMQSMFAYMHIYMHIYTYCINNHYQNSSPMSLHRLLIALDFDWQCAMWLFINVSSSSDKLSFSVRERQGSTDKVGWRGARENRKGSGSVPKNIFLDFELSLIICGKASKVFRGPTIYE